MEPRNQPRSPSAAQSASDTERFRAVLNRAEAAEARNRPPVPPMRTTVVLTLPWQKPPLSMNDRGNSLLASIKKTEKVKELRDAVLLLARAAKLPKGLDHVTVQLHYRPPDNRRRDEDNLAATSKPCFDALAAGTVKHPGYGLVPDDNPRYMTKLTARIHPADKGKPPALWLEVSWKEKGNWTWPN